MINTTELEIGPAQISGRIGKLELKRDRNQLTSACVVAAA
jgi:hypothetical protein